MHTTLSEIENVYRKELQKALENKELNPSLLVELSSTLFQSIKVESIDDFEDCDMLLCQYGTYNWYDEIGEHFSFNITRQFIAPTEDEPYQLCLTLIYEPKLFEELESYNCWNTDFADLESFIAHIKTTDGFILAEKFAPKTYKMFFEQC